MLSYLAADSFFGSIVALVFSFLFFAFSLYLLVFTIFAFVAYKRERGGK